jgi:hypothetical protein
VFVFEWRNCVMRESGRVVGNCVEVNCLLICKPLRDGVSPSFVEKNSTDTKNRNRQKQNNVDKIKKVISPLRPCEGKKPTERQIVIENDHRPIGVGRER